jgi:hypothetical protein
MKGVFPPKRIHTASPLFTFQGPKIVGSNPAMSESEGTSKDSVVALHPAILELIRSDNCVDGLSLFL